MSEDAGTSRKSARKPTPFDRLISQSENPDDEKA